MGCGGSKGGGNKFGAPNSANPATSGSSGGGSSDTLPASSCKSLYYEGSGNPDYIIASDLPLQGSGRTQTIQMGAAIRFVLKQKGFKAGKYTVGYQECDDSTAQAGSWDSGKCTSNARSYANTKKVIGVIGTFNSGCAKLEIPILNRAPGGAVGMISPANTYVGLTHTGPGTVSGEPDIYYPTGKRNYIRIVAADDFQGAADAINAKSLGLKNIYILNDKQTYGIGVATNFKNAATKLGIKVAGFSAWDAKASSYDSIASKIKQTGADAVFIGGLVCEQGGKLVKDLRNGLGAGVTLLAPDGFTPVSAVVKDAGKTAEGMYISVAGEPNSKLGSVGKQFVKQFGATQGSEGVDPYASYAAQAADVFLTAIGSSDGSRASVAANLFKTKVTNGILGSFQINANGDTNANPVSINKVTSGKQTDYKVITPPVSLVKSA
jgi:branched-chain amino acid transport system substrate-binding protein